MSADDSLGFWLSQLPLLRQLDCGIKSIPAWEIYAYEVTNLVADLKSFDANFVDDRLVNPWGLTFDDEGHLVVANNGTSVATTYQKNGKPVDRNFQINVPGDPSGLIINPFGTGFCLQKGAVMLPPFICLLQKAARFWAITR